jgi:hypothetical protein
MLDTDPDPESVNYPTVCFEVDKKRFLADGIGNREDMWPGEDLLFYFSLIPLPGKLQQPITFCFIVIFIYQVPLQK